jgi:AcrR family transcriptional regulator/DNA-binding XRE family transcriptional regulator
VTRSAGVRGSAAPPAATKRRAAVRADAPRHGLGVRLREARLAAGLTLRHTASALGISPATWSAVENGHTGITSARLKAAADLFGAGTDAFDRPWKDEPDVSAAHWRTFPPLQLSAALNGALQTFVEVGYHGATTREIAQRAGLSVPGLYHHAPTKQHLLVALLDRTMDDLLERARAARVEGDDPVARFSRLVECLALYHTHRRELAFIGASEMRSLEEPDRSRIAGLRQDMQHMVDDEVLEGYRRGVMATPLPREAARAVVTMCTALPQWWSPAGPSTAEDVADQYVEFALNLVGAER